MFLLRQKMDVMGEILDGLKNWMEAHQFGSLEDFRGRLSLQDDQLDSFYQRLQYVKSIKGE